MILFFFKGQVKSPILHNSLPYALHVILGGGLGVWIGWGRERRNPSATYLSIMNPA